MALSEISPLTDEILQRTLSESQLEYITLFEKADGISCENLEPSAQLKFLQQMHIDRGQNVPELCCQPYYKNISSLQQAEGHL